jgi:tetratricopeptide (TPR) repeat protein
MRFTTSLSIAAALALSVPAAAFADDDGTPVVILPYAPLYGEMPQSTGDRATEFVSKEVAETKGLKLVPLGEKKGDKAEVDEIELAKKEIDEAKSLFEKAAALAKAKPPKVKPAADTYEKGIQQFLLNFQGADDFKALSDAYVQLAIARFKLGNEEEAIKLLDDVIRVDPDRMLAPPEVANIFATLHAKSRKAYHAKERGQIKVLSTPAGARVTLDGKDLGETPLLARDVLPGEHYVRVTKAGQGAFWKKVKVVSGEEVSLAADLAESATGPLAAIANSLLDNPIYEATMKAIVSAGEAS